MVYLSVTQTLQGISASNFKASATLSNVFKQTVAAVLGNGILYTSVTINSVTDVVSSTLERRALASNALSISYTVSQPTTAFSSSSAAYTSLSSTLTNAVSSGSFTSTLKATAIASKAYTLVTVTASQAPTITGQPLSTPTGSPTSLTTNQKIAVGVAIGGFTVLLIIAYIIYRVNFRKKAMVPTTEPMDQFGDPFDAIYEQELTEIPIPVAPLPPPPPPPSHGNDLRLSYHEPVGDYHDVFRKPPEEHEDYYRVYTQQNQEQMKNEQNVYMP